MVFVFVDNVEKIWILVFRIDKGEIVFVFVDFVRGKQRFGGFVIVQVFKQLGVDVFDVEEVVDVCVFFYVVQVLKKVEIVFVYYD